MSFTTIDPNKIKVGDPITKEIIDFIKANFDDLDNRINQVETVGGSVHIFNGDISLSNFNPSDPYVFYYKVPKNCSLTEVRAQLFNKNGVATGTLSLDVQKATDTNNANFNSVLSSALSFDFSTDANYAQKTASINSSVSALSATNVLRVEIISIPLNYAGKIILYLGAE